MSESAPSVVAGSSPGDPDDKKGSPKGKRKKRLLPAIPNSGSSRSNSPQSNSGSESEQELKITETMESKVKNLDTLKGGHSPRTEVAGAKLAVPGSGDSSPSGSRSNSPNQIRRNSTGRILPEIPSEHRRASSGSLDYRSDNSMESGATTPRNGGLDSVDTGRTKSNSLNEDSMMNSIGGNNWELSDANGNHVTSKMIYLRTSDVQGKKKKQRPMSEGPDMHRLNIPGANKKKQRSASEGQGLRTEISPEVLQDIEVR